MPSPMHPLSPMSCPVVMWSSRPVSLSACASWVRPGIGSEMKAIRPVRSHATWTLTPVVLCLPEYSSGMVRHDQVGSRVPSTMSGSVTSRSSTVGEGLSQDGCPGCDGSRDPFLGDVELVGNRYLCAVGPQIDQGHNNTLVQSQCGFPSYSEGWRLAEVMDACDKVGDLLAAKTCARTHGKAQLSIDCVGIINYSGS